MKRLLGKSVLDAARERINLALDHTEKAYVSFSGGKDSTVMLHLVAEECRKRGRRFGVLYVDLEAQYRASIEHVEACMKEYADIADPYWVALPMNLRNAVSQYEPQWMCFDPDKRAEWVREPPASAITDPKRWRWFQPGMEFEKFVVDFADWYAGKSSAVCFVGIRSQESLNRWRTIASETKQRAHPDWPWSTQKGRAWNAYPIYDWCTEDIWTYHAKHPDAPTNKVYDLMHRAGLTIHQARLCQPYGDDQRRGLWLYHVLEPETWGRVVARVSGANQGALYAGEAGNVLGNNKVTLPEGHTWESFARMLLASMPARTAEHFELKISTFLLWWNHRGYPCIPDVAEASLEARRIAPSWRRICKALLRNDYWCKGLSFSQHKDTSSYARYQAIMRKRRDVMGSPGDVWVAQCQADGADGYGRPTSKQLALLAALTGGSTPNHAWKALGRVKNISATAARSRASMADATQAINYLKSLDATFRAETYSQSPQADRGGPVEGLPGEGEPRDDL